MTPRADKLPIREIAAFSALAAIIGTPAGWAVFLLLYGKPDASVRESLVWTMVAFVYLFGTVFLWLGMWEFQHRRRNKMM
jgi:small neutral amino acid transporter SnatA (MarC family)